MKNKNESRKDSKKVTTYKSMGFSNLALAFSLFMVWAMDGTGSGARWLFFMASIIFLNSAIAFLMVGYKRDRAQ